MQQSDVGPVQGAPLIITEAWPHGRKGKKLIPAGA